MGAVIDMREAAHKLKTPEFSCESCGSPAVTFPAILDDDEIVVCARCQAPLGTYREFRRRLEGMIKPDPGKPQATGPEHG
jgi:hypothetical protein